MTAGRLIALRPSLIIVSFLGVVHALGMVIGVLVLPKWAAFAVLLGLLLSLVAQLRKERLKGRTKICVNPEGVLAVRNDGVDDRRVVKGHVFSDRMIVLRCAPPGPWSSRDLLLAPDSAASEDLRAIRQAVLLAVRHAETAQKS